MTLEQAIDRGENRLKHNQCGRSPACGECYFCLESEALRLVLARAKEPRAYALGEEERKTLTRVLEHGDSRGEFLSAEIQAALAAALALEKPEEPFTVEEARHMRMQIPSPKPGKFPQNDPMDRQCEAKLDAYLERMPNQVPPLEP